MRIEPIEDPEDPRVADYQDLRAPALRRGLFVAEGRLVVGRLLASRFRTRSCLLTQAALDDLRAPLAAADPPPAVLVAAPEVIARIAGFRFHRGCLALGERGPEPAPGDLLAPPGPRCLVALEAVADPDNVGSIFRNAQAFGAHGVLLSPGTADPLYRKAIRTSAGATLAVPFARAADWPATLGALGAAGYTLAALTPDPAALDITALGAGRPVPARLALLLGAEGQGLSAETRRAAHLAVRIAIAPDVDSLNVATAAGIALHRLGPGGTGV